MPSVSRSARGHRRRDRCRRSVDRGARDQRQRTREGRKRPLCERHDATGRDHAVAGEAATLCLMNAERSVRGLRALRAHPVLTKVASGFAQQMAEQRFFDHVSPGGSTLLSRVKSTSYLNGSAQWSLGENIAWGTGALSTPRATVASWMKSPPHRKNLLATQFTEVGIGIAVGGGPKNVNPDGLGSTYVTDFGQRSATAQLAKAKPATK